MTARDGIYDFFARLMMWPPPQKRGSCSYANAIFRQGVLKGGLSGELDIRQWISRQHFPRMRQRVFGNRDATQHASDFIDTFLRV